MNLFSQPSGGSLEFNAVSKFYGDQDPRYGGRLHWPGLEGLPFRGDIAPKISDSNKNKLYVACDANHGTFDLSDPEQSKSYAWVRDRIQNGLFRLDHIHRQWHEEKCNMIIYLEWTQLYNQIAGQE
jgi:hypothetical protein